MVDFTSKQKLDHVRFIEDVAYSTKHIQILGVCLALYAIHVCLCKREMTDTFISHLHGFGTPTFTKSFNDNAQRKSLLYLSRSQIHMHLKYSHIYMRYSHYIQLFNFNP